MIKQNFLVLTMILFLSNVAYSEALVPTFTDEAYGEHELNKFDFFQAEGKGPHPWVLYIHGGGWVSGDKSEKKVPDRTIKALLKSGISYARINYRLAKDHPLPAPVMDAAYALQYIRHNHKKYNIIKDKVVLMGGSAGGASSLLLATWDDLADPKNSDPVKRESTRVQGAVIGNGQCSINIEQCKEWIGDLVLKQPMMFIPLGEPSAKSAWKNKKKYNEVFHRYSAINHLDKNDPPLLLGYGKDLTVPATSVGHGIHHPIFGVKMKEKADEVGHKSYLSVGGKKDSTYENNSHFINHILLGKK